ncbi:uncharacterized protein [Nicotiana tomentosiformis]|uniref:uncharacterized protein n=1 Tax=Nicotiana tomentosiformis TaxID=4098 RepID=UPI00388C6190
MKKTPEEIVTILDELSEDANQWPSEISERRRSTGVHQVDANTSLHVQLDAMVKELRNLTLASIHNEPHTTCDICGRGYPTHECQASTEEVNVMGNYNFNAMGQKHSCFSRSSPGVTANAWQQNNSRFQGAPGFVNQPRQQFQPQQSNQPGLEDLMKFFIVKTDERLDAHGAAIKELGTGLRNLEKQVGQIATILSERIPEPTPIQKDVVPAKESGEQLKIEVDQKKKGKKGAEKKKKEETSRRDESEESKHKPALPFSQKLYREKLDKQIERSMDMLKQVNKLENELGEIRSAPISLQLADQTTIIHKGIMEDVLVRVDKFVFSSRLYSGEDEGEQRGPPYFSKTILSDGKSNIRHT